MKVSSVAVALASASSLADVLVSRWRWKHTTFALTVGLGVLPLKTLQRNVALFVPLNSVVQNVLDLVWDTVNDDWEGLLGRLW